MTDITRREWIRSLGTLTAGAWSTDIAASLLAQTRLPQSRRIDIHHHFAPPAWLAEVKGRPLLNAANTTWTVERSLEDLDKAGTAAAVISVTNPGLWFGDDDVTTRLARTCNDYAASLVQRYPTRFGMFAAMPLPSIDATLKEIEYAYGALKTDGIGLFTSYDDQWLGNAAFRPVMEELNRRRAVVHVHPTAANCCRNLPYGLGAGNVEYGTDTTRAIVGVTFSGDTTRYPDIRFIWSHAGGTAPFLAGRIDGASGRARDQMPAGFMAEAKKFFYDTAGATNRGAVTSLLELVPSSQILFGTDFPPSGPTVQVVERIRRLGVFNEADLRAIERDNATRLLPRLRDAAV